MNAPLTKLEVDKVLNDHSTKIYSITYKGYRANHMPHGISALYKLGATQNKIDDYIKNEALEMEHPSSQPHQTALPDGKDVKDFDFNSIRGKRIAYYPILDYYEHLLNKECEKSISKFLVMNFLPKRKGLITALLHPVIHMGYGCDMNNPRLVVEGMSYLHHSNLELCLHNETSYTFGEGTVNLFDVLDEIRNNQVLEDRLKRESDVVWKGWVQNELNGDESSFNSPSSKRTVTVCLQMAEDILAYACKIRLPEWFVSNNPLQKISNIERLLNWVIDGCIKVYSTSEYKNDFYLLHAITGAWGLKQICCTIGGDDNFSNYNDLVECIEMCLCSILVVYIVVGSPKCNRQSFPISDQSWKEITNRCLDENHDSHVYKLVQICRERSNDETHKSEEQENMYKQAALIAMDHPFYFFKLK